MIHMHRLPPRLLTENTAARNALDPVRGRLLNKSVLCSSLWAGTISIGNSWKTFGLFKVNLVSQNVFKHTLPTFWVGLGGLQ